MSRVRSGRTSNIAGVEDWLVKKITNIANQQGMTFEQYVKGGYYRPLGNEEDVYNIIASRIDQPATTKSKRTLRQESRFMYDNQIAANQNQWGSPRQTFGAQNQWRSPVNQNRWGSQTFGAQTQQWGTSPKQTFGAQNQWGSPVKQTFGAQNQWRSPVRQTQQFQKYTPSYRSPQFGQTYY